MAQCVKVPANPKIFYRNTLNQEACNVAPAGSSPFNSVDSCQQNTGNCANPGGMFARWALTPPVNPGHWSSRMPYPDCQRWGGKPGLCVPSPVGQFVGASECIKAESPFIYQGHTY